MIMKPETFQPHFIRSHFTIMEEFKGFKRKQKNKLSNDFDKLFFQFLIIIMYPIDLNYNKNEEHTIKYKISEDLQNKKHNHKKDIVENLCFDEHINLHTLDYLAKIYKKNLIYLHLNVYIKMLHGNKEDKVYMVTKDKDIYPMKYDNESFFMNKYEITNIYKPLYSLSHYKVDMLKSMIEILKLETNPKDTKQIYYERIENHLNVCLL